jgi:hypothetical protein
MRRFGRPEASPVVPLDPPPTEAELAWWRPRQRLLEWRQHIGNVLIVGFVLVVPVTHHRLNEWATDPVGQLISFAIGGVLAVIFTRTATRNNALAKMPAAIRERRMNDALLAPPSE